jgi:hypothetical protein
MGDGWHDQIGIPQRRERDENHPVRERAMQLGRCLERQTRLADPQRAPERQQAHLRAR